MYICGQLFQQSMDQPGTIRMVVNPARGQLNRETNVFPCPHLRLKIWSRETGSAIPVPRQRAHSPHTPRLNLVLTYFRDSSRFPRRRPHNMPSTAISPVPSLSGHAIADRWHSLPRVCRHRASSSSPQSNSSNRCCLFRCHHGPIKLRLSFPAPTIILVCRRRMCDT